VHVVLKVDEKTYDYSAGYDRIPLKGMGENHPIAWCHHYDGGRVFYTSLGHKPHAYSNGQFLSHLYGGIYWAVNNNSAHSK